MKPSEAEEEAKEKEMWQVAGEYHTPGKPMDCYGLAPPLIVPVIRGAWPDLCLGRLSSLGWEWKLRWCGAHYDTFWFFFKWLPGGFHVFL